VRGAGRGRQRARATSLSWGLSEPSQTPLLAPSPPLPPHQPNSYKALSEFSKEDARSQFLRILRTLPYGSSTFFTVKRIEDPIGLLPAKLVLGINKRGVHFFRWAGGVRQALLCAPLRWPGGPWRRRVWPPLQGSAGPSMPPPPTPPARHPARPVPKEYLHSAELRDIMQFGSSSQAVFFKMRVAGVLHVFQFETRQGEDICMALQTHINDVMVKRYTKVGALGWAGGGSC
jgi:hypothetical protein